MPLTRISLGAAWRPAEFAQLSALFIISAAGAAPVSCCFIFSPGSRAAGRRNRGSTVGCARG